MKQPSKNEIELLELINKIHAQLILLDKKVDTLINRSTQSAKPSLTPTVNNSQPTVKSNDHNKSNRTMFTATCADCKKECSIPFKPSGDRPVYCQDCFSRRKVIKLSNFGNVNKTQETPAVQPELNKSVEAQKSPAKTKKKAVAVKKPVAKKKATPKKK